jgi:hypothetical protein
MKRNRNEKISQIKNETLVFGIDNEVHYARDFDYRVPSWQNYCVLATLSRLRSLNNRAPTPPSISGYFSPGLLSSTCQPWSANLRTITTKCCSAPPMTSFLPWGLSSPGSRATEKNRLGNFSRLVLMIKHVYA